MSVQNYHIKRIFFILLLAWILILPEKGMASILFVSSDANAGAGSLRDQVALANSGDTIMFNINGIIRVDSSIQFTKDLVVIGPGFDKLIVDGQDKFRIFQVLPFHDVQISNLHFRNGNASNLISTGGAAIEVIGNLTLKTCLFEGNTGEYGGAVHVFNRNVDTVFFEMINCSFINNRSTILDGGALNISYAGVGYIVARITNCVFTENSSAKNGGAINLFGQQNGGIDLEINSCTIARNTASLAGGISNLVADTISLFNTIFTENKARVSYPNGSGNIISEGYNLIGDTLGFSFQPLATDIIGANSGLGPLIEKGEWIPSVGLLCGSLAIDNGALEGTSTVDVRGLNRDMFPDIGAHERLDTWDKRIYTKEDGAAGSLRLALEYACPGDTLSLENIIGEIELDTQIVISKNIVLVGNQGAIGTKFLNKGNQRFFVVENQTEVAFHNLSFWGGNPTQNGGGAILNKGKAHIYNSTFAYNSAISGGALANYGDGDSAMMVLTNCTFSNNKATVLDGGAIDNYGFSHPAQLSLNHCTMVKNSSKKKGGAIFNNNKAGATIKNTILALNQAPEGSETYGGFTSLGNNLWLDTTFTRSVFQVTDLVNIQPDLDSFAYYGGSNYTYRPKAGSPVIDAGNSDNAPSTDQRGLNRFFGTSVDIGSYEYDPATSLESSVSQVGAFSVYPNPTSDRLWIDFKDALQNESCSISIYSLTGKCIYKNHFEKGPEEGNLEISISDYPKGVYVLIGMMGTRRYYQKVVFE